MQIDRKISKGQLVPLQFTQDAVAADQTDVQLSIMENAATGIHLVDGIPMPFAGEIVAVTAALDSAGSAGSLAVGASIGGTENANTTLTFSTETELELLVPRGLVPFVAGDLIGVEITTDSSWNGTSSDLGVWVWVLLALEGI